MLHVINNYLHIVRIFGDPKIYLWVQFVGSFSYKGVLVYIAVLEAKVQGYHRAKGQHVACQTVYVASYIAAIPLCPCVIFFNCSYYAVILLQTNSF